MDHDTLTKMNSDFDEWHGCLMRYAKSKSGSAADRAAWKPEYNAGKTPAKAWFDEWGE